MSMRLATTVLLAAVLAMASDADAKPPDLPADPTTRCEETPAGSLLFGVGVHSDAGLTGSVQFTETGPSDGASTSQSRCPYARPGPFRPPQDARDLVRGVLENLQRLEAAESLCRKAERHARAGRLDDACRCYDEARLLCPGSRYEIKAADRLRELFALREMRRNGADAEEQEAELIPPPEPVDDAGEDYDIVVEEQSAPPSFWQRMLGGVCAEIDVRKPGCVRARCQFRIGEVEIRLIVQPSSAAR